MIKINGFEHVSWAASEVEPGQSMGMAVALVDLLDQHCFHNPSSGYVVRTYLNPEYTHAYDVRNYSWE